MYLFLCICLRVQDLNSLLRLWFHECSRVFQDRLVNNEDRTWFEELLVEKMTSDMAVNVGEVLPQHYPIYGDFMGTADNKQYEEVDDVKKVSNVVKQRAKEKSIASCGY